MKYKQEKIHSKAFIDGVIIDRDDLEIIYNNKTKKIRRRKICRKNRFDNIPILRGINRTFYYLIMSLKANSLTMATLGQEMEENEVSITAKEEMLLEKTNLKLVQLLYFLGIFLGFLISMISFIFIPSFIVFILSKIIDMKIILSIIEGSLRLILFLLYLRLINKIPEIKKMHMYHSAEHKILNCLLNNQELTLENIRDSSPYYSNCGTYNLIKLAIIMVFYFSFLSFNVGYFLNTFIRILLSPIIIGIAYELKVVFVSNTITVSWLGRKIQDLFLEDPDDKTIRVLICLVKKAKESNEA